LEKPHAEAQRTQRARPKMVSDTVALTIQNLAIS